eukprot:1160308-Pelagomonas_calceolata.AAC.6
MPYAYHPFQPKTFCTHRVAGTASKGNNRNPCPAFTPLATLEHAAQREAGAASKGSSSTSRPTLTPPANLQISALREERSSACPALAPPCQPLALCLQRNRHGHEEKQQQLMLYARNLFPIEHTLLTGKQAQSTRGLATMAALARSAVLRQWPSAWHPSRLTRCCASTRCAQLMHSGRSGLKLGW